MRKDLQGVKHVSYSQIDKYRKCPRSWEYSYVKGIWGPATPNLVVGNVYHGVLEQCFKCKMETGENIDYEIAIDALNSVWEKETKNKDIDWQGEDKDSLFNQCSQLIGVYIDTMMPSIMPAEVEKELQIPLSDGTLFICRYDLRDVKGVVYDHKTANPGAVSLTYSQGNIDKHLQPTATAFALNHPIVFNYHLSVKSARPYIKPIRTMRCEQDIEYFGVAVEQIVAAMGTGIYPPNEDGWWCSELYCPQYAICRPGIHRTVITKE